MNASPWAWLEERLHPSRHTLYFEVLDALQQDGCPLCRLVLRALSWYLDMLAYETVNDQGIRARLRAARGFCHGHAWQFTREVRNGAGRAMLYRDILIPLQHALAGRPASGADDLADRLLPNDECPACRSMAQATRRYLDTFVLHLSGAELRQHYLASRGLCLPHLTLALREARRPADVELLLGVAANWAASLGLATRLGLHGPTARIVAGVAGGRGAIVSARARGIPGASVGNRPCGPPDASQPASGCCPVCQGAVAAVQAYLARLPATVSARMPGDAPAEALSFCNAHAWRVLELVAPGPAARLWQPAARSARRLVAEAATPHDVAGRRWWRALAGTAAARPGQWAAARLAERRPCPACAVQARGEQKMTLALLRQVQEEGLVSGPGPCLPHLALGLRLAQTTRQWQILAAHQARSLEALGGELLEYIRKQNFRCREGRGPEADSPWRAVSQVAGAEGLEAGPWMWAPRAGK